MTTDRVREIVAAHTRLAVDVATLADEDNLYNAGLTSHASVNLMLALEEAFDIEFPERCSAGRRSNRSPQSRTPSTSSRSNRLERGRRPDGLRFSSKRALSRSVRHGHPGEQLEAKVLALPRGGERGSLHIPKPWARRSSMRSSVVDQ
jgi:acyl carrier protein